MKLTKFKQKLFNIGLNSFPLFLDTVTKSTVLDVLQHYIDVVGLLAQGPGTLLVDVVTLKVHHNRLESGSPPLLMTGSSRDKLTSSCKPCVCPNILTGGAVWYKTLPCGAAFTDRIS